MFQKFYRLNDDPFRLTPDPACVYMTVQHREALSGLVYSACTRPGLSVLSGEAGTGKTTLLHVLIGLLEKRRFNVVLCTNPTLTRDEFYDYLLPKLDIACESMLKSRRIVALQEYLARQRIDGRHTILIMDEAQGLSMELLEEIRLLLNMETAREKMLDIILSGQPELAETLNRPDLRQFKQRISSVCKLEPLDIDGVREYISFRLAKAGREGPPLFSEDAIRAIYDTSGGIPRVVNVLCNNALQSGFATGATEFGAELIHEVAADHELLPRHRSSANPLMENHHPLPAENHAGRQETHSLFGSLIDRWK